MAYMAARGGEAAIEQAERFFREALGPITAERVREIETALPYLVDRVMGEASLYAPELAALALAQSGGDLSEAVLLLRAYRTSQPRLGYAEPVDWGEALTVRRVSAAFKDVPGGQVLGPTLDYSHRLLAVDVLASGRPAVPVPVAPAAQPAPPTLPTIADWERREGLVPPVSNEPPTPPEAIPDLTREPLLFPAPRPHKLQALARADTGGVLALGYANMRGYGSVHPTVNEVRLAEAEVRLAHPKGGSFSAGRVRVSGAEIVSKSAGAAGHALALGFSATLGWNEIKVIAAAMLDLATDQVAPHPAHTTEFVLYHTEAVEAAGFCLHYKLPHYVTFQSALEAMRRVRADTSEAGKTAASAPIEAPPMDREAQPMARALEEAET